MDTETYLTKEKYAEMEKELEHLTSVGRTEMAEQLDSAKSLGDLKENAEYHQAREDQAVMEERINHITASLKSATIIKGGKHSIVEIGAEVTVARKGSSAKMTYNIVGREEADPGEGKLSMDSPLVQAMLEKSEGEFFDFTTPDGEKVEWKVVEVK